jgi:Esterase/lipase
MAQAFVDAIAAKGGEPVYKLPIPEARKALVDLQSQAVEKPHAQIEDRVIPGGPVGEISIRIVRPENAQGKLPAVMYFHGGGWILGDKDTHDRLLREIANGAQAAVIFVNFTPSPEARYPVAIEQAYGATQYAAEHGDELDLDPSHLVVVGDSVGGNMATVVAMMAKERGGPKIDYQVLFYPVTDASMSTPSYKQFADGPWLAKAGMEWFWNAYEPESSRRKDPHISPLNASPEQLRGLPPALVITDENDVLRDEGEAYAYKLMNASVKVTAVRYLGAIHDFLMLNALAQAPFTRSAINLTNTTLRSVFSG